MQFRIVVVVVPYKTRETMGRRAHRWNEWNLSAAKRCELLLLEALHEFRIDLRYLVEKSHNSLSLAFEFVFNFSIISPFFFNLRSRFSSSSSSSPHRRFFLISNSLSFSWLSLLHRSIFYAFSTARAEQRVSRMPCKEKKPVEAAEELQKAIFLSSKVNANQNSALALSYPAKHRTHSTRLDVVVFVVQQHRINCERNFFLFSSFSRLPSPLWH